MSPKLRAHPPSTFTAKSTAKTLRATALNTTTCASREGRGRANIVIPYSEKYHVGVIRARTIHADGTIVNFDGQVFDKIVEKTKGVKVKAKVFTAPDVQVGSIIEYHFFYNYEDQWIFNSYWPVSDELFTRRVAILGSSTMD